MEDLQPTTFTGKLLVSGGGGGGILLFMILTPTNKVGCLKSFKLTQVNKLQSFNEEHG